VAFVTGTISATLIQMASIAVLVMILAMDGSQIRKYLSLFLWLIANYMIHLVLIVVVVVAFPTVAVTLVQTSLLFASLLLYLMLFFRVMERFEFFTKQRVVRDWGVATLALVGAILPFFIIYFRSYEDASNLALLQVVVAFVCITLTITYMLRRQKERLKYELERQYILDVEQRQLEIRRFRHDYVNVLLTLSRFFEEEDLQGMKAYFDEEIMPTGRFLREQNIELGNLANLNVPEVKSLCSVKIMEAQSHDIETFVEIPREIGCLHMKSSILARILGILLDNAIEECVCCEQPSLHIGIFEREELQQIIIKNTCRKNSLTPKQMFDKGFTTKGKNRGLGLSNVRTLLDSLDNATIKTVVENGYFIQELQIRRGE